jgi:purine-cytosine permease-like protein
VYAFFSGNSKAAAIIAAGITLVGGVAVLAASTALMVSWLPLLKWIVPVLGIIAVGLWAYQHYYRSKKIETLEMVKDYLDSDKDGRVTAADIKTVLGIG